MNKATQASSLLASLKQVKRQIAGPIEAQIVSLKMRLGMNVSLPTPDRHILETVIIPYFAARNDCRRILFVGCQWYTKHYEKFFEGKEYWTIEIDPQAEKYGAEHHVIDSLQNLDAHFVQGYFDLIVYNGVFGWGINTQVDADQAFSQCHRSLREGGFLVFGWNNIPERSPFPPETCSNLARFKSFTFPPLLATEYLVPNSAQNHTFKFFCKP